MRKPDMTKPDSTTKPGAPKPWVRRTLALLSLCVLGAVGVSARLAAQQIDGVVSEGEYPFRTELAGGAFRLHWSLQGDAITIAISADTEGWVAVGTGPGPIMADADMMFGWVDADGTAFMRDSYSIDTYGPHPTDEELGGRMDITAYAGTEKDGVTTLEFSRPMRTGDEYDRDFPSEGTLPIIWAFGDTDAFEQVHVKAGFGSLDMGTGEAAPSPSPLLFVAHLALMSVSFLLMLAAMLVSRYMKRRRWWLKAHRPMGIIGAVLGAGGVVSAYYMIELTSGVHLRVLHSVLGIVTLGLFVVTPIIGQMFLKLRWNRQLLRKSHRWLGRLALVMMAVVIVLGLREAGIL